LPSSWALMMVCEGLFKVVLRSALVCALVLPPALAHAATILVYGDSLSAAYGLSREQGWVHLLERRLHAEKLNYKVANASLSGETTLGGRNRIGAALKEHRPAIVILELGANDGLRGGSIATVGANLEAIIDASRAAGARVLLVGIRLPPNYGTAYTEKFQQTYRDLARKKKVRLVPYFFEGIGEKRDYFQPDGIHPTAQAQPLLLDTVWKELRPLLKKP
jgi:acyl-CoA thioesterase-1